MPLHCYSYTAPHVAIHTCMHYKQYTVMQYYVVASEVIDDTSQAANNIQVMHIYIKRTNNYYYGCCYLILTYADLTNSFPKISPPGMFIGPEEASTTLSSSMTPGKFFTSMRSSTSPSDKTYRMSICNIA